MLRLHMLGIDYQTAPLAIRELCWLSPAQVGTSLLELPILLDGAPALGGRSATVRCSEAVILSTCSRLEFYVVAEEATAAHLFDAWLSRLESRARHNLRPYFRRLPGRDVIAHLLNLVRAPAATSLAEPFVLQQVQDALHLAHSHGTDGRVLQWLFHHVIQEGLRATTSEGGDGAAALPRAVTDFVRRHHPELSRGRLLVVGTSKLAQLAAHLANEMHVPLIATINRTEEHASITQRQLPGTTFAWHQMRQALVWADVIVTATPSLHPILDEHDFVAAQRLRQGRPLVLFDLGFPRNVHPAVAGIGNLHYYTVDTMRNRLSRDFTGQPALEGAYTCAQGLQARPLPSVEVMAHELWDACEQVTLDAYATCQGTLIV